MSFYESDPISDAPLLELPAFQYGSWGLPGMPGMPGSFRRNNASMLEPARAFLWQNYSPQNYILPKTVTLLAQSPSGILPLQQVEDRIQVPAGSYILGYSAAVITRSGVVNGFRWSIFDEGAQDFVLTDKWQPYTDGVDDGDGGTPHMLAEPYLVVSPGRLQIRVVNMDNVTSDFQLCTYLAVPRRPNPNTI